MKRIIKEIIIHCSATKEDKDYTVADIDRWHRARGFKKIGIISSSTATATFT